MWFARPISSPEKNVKKKKIDKSLKYVVSV